ncbi:MAG: hypothetical protein U9N77_10540 [Thermodesulfobacteriota bacterium]|nr:hypothetical protein [Thermodesulfobacteriota bacterium]
MTHTQPEGENLRKAVKFISDEREENPAQNMVSLVDSASLRFDLTPEDSEFLLRFVRESED